MTVRSATDFTGAARDAKNSLDSLFQIPLKEDVLTILNAMKERNTKTNASSLSDLDKKLLDILYYDKRYFSKNKKVLPDGTITVKSLFEKAAEDEKGGGLFRDIERNARVIKVYERYAENLDNTDRLDRIFLGKLNTLFTQYKSSSDYMERLVKRLLKFNFNYSDEAVKDVETRVLILRQLINAYGYDCVDIISSPELEGIVKKEYAGDVENITDDIFRYLDGNEDSDYEEEYIEALVELQATIIYKASTISMTKELCEELCSLVFKNAIEPQKSKTAKPTENKEKKILSAGALDGTAKLLKNCFENPEKFAIPFIKDYKNVEIDKILDFKQKLDALYKSGKKNQKGSFADIDESIRMSILFGNFSKEINASEKIVSLFSAVFPKMILKKGKMLSDCIDEENLTTIKCVKQSNIVKDSDRRSCIRLLLDECEKGLDEDKKKKYQALIYKKIGERYNGATNPSKKDSLYKKANEIFNVNETEYKLLKIADDLANAKFSPHGKTREYLYIFAIAFGMTATGYDTDLWIADEATKENVLKEDPRKKTDIQKNLFLDYYSDNIVNNLTSVNGFNKHETDVFVDGYGINYKNFAEVTFLWCIKQESMTAKEKLKLAYEIIEYCRNKGQSVEAFKKANINSAEEKTTQIYKGYYADIGIQIQEKADFQDFLIKNYPCRFNGSMMKINGSGLAAGKELEKQQERVMALLQRVEMEIFDSWDPTSILNIISDRDNTDKEISKVFILIHYLRELRCKKCTRRKGDRFPYCDAYFEPYSWTDEKGVERSISSCEDFCADKKIDTETLRKSLKNFAYIGDDCEGDFERRLTTLSSLCHSKHSNLKNILQEIEKRININVLHLKKEKVSRTALVALCYLETVLMNYLHRVFNENHGRSIDVRTFGEFYKMFCEGRTIVVEDYNEDSDEDMYVDFIYPGANAILEKAGYQKIDSKNLFDIYVIFLAFKDNYKNLFELPNGNKLIADAERINEKLKSKKREIEENKNNGSNLSEDR